MHTATRLALPVIERVRRVNRDARLCCYGVYAPPNADLLQSLGVDAILGGEFEADLLAFVGLTAAQPTSLRASSQPTGGVPRLRFLVPDRSGLPPLARYASLQLPDGERRITGYTEASRGCKHLCRHCPIVPIYGAQFRIVPRDVVLADIGAQVAAGARHITFGDPDFFNGVRHALDIVTAMPKAFPGVTYDVTIKIQHLLRHRASLPILRDTGCLFVTSAVESFDDRFLLMLEKEHTRDDFIDAVGLCRRAGLNLSLTFVAFHPWMSLAGYVELLDTIESLDLVENVAPIQLAIRLLIPEGSRLLELDTARRAVGPFDPVTLSYPWRHPDPAVDDLQGEVMRLVARLKNAGRREAFEAVATLACARSRIVRRPAARGACHTSIPYLTEPWYCCAEPTPEQLAQV
jgi:hypothetical protein